MATNDAAFDIDDCQSLITLSSDELIRYPEASQCLRQLAAVLRTSGASSELQDQLAKEKSEAELLDLKLREKKLFIQCVKEVLRDEVLNGYQHLPQEIIEKLMDQMTLAQMQEENSSSNLYTSILGLNSALRPTDFKLNNAHKSTLLKSVEAKINELAERCPLGTQEKLSQALQGHLLALAREKTKAALELKSHHQDLLNKVLQCKQKQQFEELNLNIMKLSMEIEVYKAKIADIRLAQSMYSTVQEDALKLLKTQKTKDVAQKQALNKELAKKLSNYDKLPKAEFNLLVEKHKDVTKKIEHMNWNIQNLDKDQN